MAKQRGITREENFRDAIANIPSTFEMSWGIGPNSEDFEGTPLGRSLNAIRGLGDTLAGFIDATEIILQFFIEALDLALTNLGIVVDLFDGVVVAINLLLTEFRDFLIGTSVHMLYHFPTSYKSRRTPSEILYDIGMSYLDKTDFKKPFSNVNNQAAVVIAMWSLPDLQQLRDIFERVQLNVKGLNKDSFGDPSFKNGYYLDPDFISQGSSANPDWMFGYSLSEFTPFRIIAQALQEAITKIDSKRSHLAKYQQVIALLQNRLDSIGTLISDLSQTLQAVISLFSLGDSSGIFICKGLGTNEDFARAVINAPNHPDYPSVENLDYVDFNKPQSAINIEAGRSALFSGAIAFHFQVGDGGSEERLDAILDLFRKQRDELLREENSDFERLTERFNQIDLSGNRLRNED